jgi:hypothetical protein
MSHLSVWACESVFVISELYQLPNGSATYKENPTMMKMYYQMVVIKSIITYTSLVIVRKRSQLQLPQLFLIPRQQQSPHPAILRERLLPLIMQMHRKHFA